MVYFSPDNVDFRAKARKLLDPAVRLWLRVLPPRVPYPEDFTADDIALCAAVTPYTMTSAERIVALSNSVGYVVRNDIPGAIVECGVWRGGSMMVVGKTLLKLGCPDRELYLFDTFEGMTPPEAVDREVGGKTGAEILATTERRPDFRQRAEDPSRWLIAHADFNMWCIADESDVEANMASTSYPMDLVHLVRGRVEDTIPERAPDTIALLRLDTDWYASTKHELENLWPRLSPGGVLIIDDYGHWEGAHRAVDEFFARMEHPPLLQRIDATGRCAIKPA
jgi:O-methyltransferase